MSWDLLPRLLLANRMHAPVSINFDQTLARLPSLTEIPAASSDESHQFYRAARLP
jgi:hypothetical protein